MAKLLLFMGQSNCMTARTSRQYLLDSSWSYHNDIADQDQVQIWNPYAGGGSGGWEGYSAGYNSGAPYGTGLGVWGPEASAANIWQTFVADVVYVWKITEVASLGPFIPPSSKPLGFREINKAANDLYPLWLFDFLRMLAAFPGGAGAIDQSVLYWIQGESDMFTYAQALNYESEFVQFVTDWRRDTGLSNLEVCFSLLHDSYENQWVNTTGRHAINNGIRRIADGVGHTLADITRITNDSPQKTRQYVPGNETHYDWPSVVQLGIEMAQFWTVHGGVAYTDDPIDGEAGDSASTAHWLQNDAAAIADLDVFGEQLTYIPATGGSRSIIGIVNRTLLSLDDEGQQIKDTVSVWVPFDASIGLEDVAPGVDTIEVALQWGETPVACSVVGLIEHDEGGWLLEVRR